MDGNLVLILSVEATVLIITFKSIIDQNINGIINGDLLLSLMICPCLWQKIYCFDHSTTPPLLFSISWIVNFLMSNPP